MVLRSEKDNFCMVPGRNQSLAVYYRLQGRNWQVTFFGRNQIFCKEKDPLQALLAIQGFV